MSRMNALAGRGTRALEPTEDGPLEATVARTPTLVSDDVLVTLHDFDEHRTVGPVLGWRTEPQAMWPTRGERVLVIQAPQGDYWLIGRGTLTPPSVTPGELKAAAYTTPDPGWLHCNGASLLRTAYPALFAKIGVAYGTVDGTHFNVPNMLGRVAMGADPSNLSTATGHTAHALGQSAGEETHLLTTPEIPAHVHGLSHGAPITMDNATVGGTRRNVDYNVRGDGTAGNLLGTDSTGGGGTHNNLPPFVTVNWFIKT